MVSQARNRFRKGYALIAFVLRSDQHGPVSILTRSRRVPLELKEQMVSWNATAVDSIELFSRTNL